MRISAELKAQAEAAAMILDTTLSQVAREAFEQLVERSNLKRIKENHFREKLAGLGVDTLPMTNREQVDFDEYGIDTRKLSKTQRAAVRRGVRSGRLEKPGAAVVQHVGQSKPSMRDEVIASLRRRAADGVISQEEAEERIRRMEEPNRV